MVWVRRRRRHGRGVVGNCGAIAEGFMKLAVKVLALFAVQVAILGILLIGGLR